MLEAEQGTISVTPWAAIVGVIATVSIFAIAQGLTYPLLSFILQRQGISPSLIGLSAAMTPLGFVLSAPLIPVLARRFGAGNTALTCAVISAFLLGLIGWTSDVWLWFPLRFLLGLAVNPLYVLSETWLITLAPAAQRGRIMGLYTSIISAGFACGPLALTIAGTEGWPPFLVGIVAFLICAAWLSAVLRRLPVLHGSGEQASVMRFLTRAPLLLFAVFSAAVFEQAVLSLMSVYGRAYGQPEATVSALLAIFIAGNIALQIPLGRAAERFGSARLLILCALGTVVGCAVLPFLFGTAAGWPLMFVWGALSFGIYTMALVELAERFGGALLVAGNAAFAMVWGVGGIAGPPLIGLAMDRIGAQGLPLAGGLLCTALTVLYSVQHLWRSAK